jgi:hypothetical protein
MVSPWSSSFRTGTHAYPGAGRPNGRAPGCGRGGLQALFDYADDQVSAIVITATPTAASNARPSSIRQRSDLSTA